MATPNQTLPSFYSMKATDKDGNMTSDLSLYMDQTFQTLNSVITINGVTVPTLQAAPTPTSTGVGTTWYNSTLNKLQFMGIVAGVPTVQTITST